MKWLRWFTINSYHGQPSAPLQHHCLFASLANVGAAFTGSAGASPFCRRTQVVISTLPLLRSDRSNTRAPRPPIGPSGPVPPLIPVFRP